MDRRTVLASLGAVVAASPLVAQELAERLADVCRRDDVLERVREIRRKDLRRILRVRVDREVGTGRVRTASVVAAAS